MERKVISLESERNWRRSQNSTNAHLQEYSRAAGDWITYEPRIKSVQEGSMQYRKTKRSKIPPLQKGESNIRLFPRVNYPSEQSVALQRKSLEEIFTAVKNRQKRTKQIAEPTTFINTHQTIRADYMIPSTTQTHVVYEPSELATGVSDKEAEHTAEGKTVQENSERSAKEMEEITALQKEFDAALNRAYSAKDVLTRNYNPVVDRWHVEQLLKSGDFEGLEKFKAEIWSNMRTSLLERSRVAESIYEYKILDGELYSKDFPKEPFRRVLERGVEWRAQNGSPEQEREQAELLNWDMVTKWAMDREGRKKRLVSFSRHGMVEGTSYESWFVDEYKYVDVNPPYVTVTRKSVDLNDISFDQAALRVDKTIFNGFNPQKVNKDVWLLLNPRETDQEFTVPLSGMALKDFEEIYNGNQNRHGIKQFIDHYLSILFEKDINWRDLAIAFNAILNKTDEEVELFKKQKDGLLVFTANNYSSVEEEIYELGMRAVRAAASFGCPSSKGYAIPGELVQFFGGGYENSVARFAAMDRKHWKWEPGICRLCEQEAMAKAQSEAKKHEELTGERIEVKVQIAIRSVGPCNICESCQNKFDRKAA
jgi:hypothetical protein